MVRLRFQRSTKTPAMGEMNAKGRKYEMRTRLTCVAVPCIRNEMMAKMAKMARKSPKMLTICPYQSRRSARIWSTWRNESDRGALDIECSRMRKGGAERVFL